MILDDIAADTRRRVKEAKRTVSLEEMKRRAEDLNRDTGFPFEAALKNPGMHYICEVKKASPSKGIIADDFPYIEIAKEYERAGATAVSCLTEPTYFQGKNEYLQEIKKEIKLPVLRKDFVIDEYMIYEAKVINADIVLLICALLDAATLKRYIGICHMLGLSALVEVHDEDEMQQAIQAGARVIGVNNRNLKDFTVDIGNSIRLRSLAPKEILFVAESGISTPQDINELKRAKVNGALIGEAFMRSDNKKEMLEFLDGGR